MKNMLGEDVVIHPIRFEFTGTHLNIFRGPKYIASMAKNGWNKYSRTLQYPVGEPIITQWDEYEPISISDMKAIIAEWNRVCP
jgi:hypothetical protein